MSKLAEFRAAERALADQLAQLESLKNDSALKKEIEFEGKLRDLMAEYGQSLRQVVALLDPNGNRSVTAPTGERKPRAMKVYRNPHTGEVVETKGGNHRVLKAWREEFGSGTVDSWQQR